MPYESVMDMNEIGSAWSEFFFSVFRFVNQGKSLCDSDAYSVVQGNQGILSLSQWASQFLQQKAQWLFASKQEKMRSLDQKKYMIYIDNYLQQSGRYDLFT